MLGFNLKKYSLKLINKQIRHIFYFQISINLFLRYFLISGNEVIFYDDLCNFCKTCVIIYFSCTFFVCTLLMSQMHACEALITNVYQFQQSHPLLFDHSHTLGHFLKLWTPWCITTCFFRIFLKNTYLTPCYYTPYNQVQECTFCSKSRLTQKLKLVVFILNS